jgi:hypothetical protein
MEKRPMYSVTVRAARWTTISLREINDGLFALEVAKVDSGTPEVVRFEPQTIVVQLDNLVTIGGMIHDLGLARLSPKKGEEEDPKEA